MNFTYRVIKRNEHEPTLNVLYVPESEALSQRFAKVRYEPEFAVGLNTYGLTAYIHELVVKAAPVHHWEHEAEACHCAGDVDAVLLIDEEIAVSDTEYTELTTAPEEPDDVVEV